MTNLMINLSASTDIYLCASRSYDLLGDDVSSSLTWEDGW